MVGDIQNAVEVLRQGGVILYPTDTIWGLGCDATHDEAVEKIYRIKQRHDEKSMLILLDNESKLPYYVSEVPDIAWNILEVTDKPITIIYSGACNLSKNLIAGDGSIGIRIVQDDFCKRLIHRFGKPIVSTSANRSGKPWPENFATIDPAILKSVDYVVNWRQQDTFMGRPSGIIKVGAHGQVKVIRE